MLAWCAKSRVKRLCCIAVLLISVLLFINFVLIGNNLTWTKKTIRLAQKKSEEAKDFRINLLDMNSIPEEEEPHAPNLIHAGMWQPEPAKHVLPPEHRVVHLDFKGAPPKLSYIRSLFPLLASAGANALLIEYEDMFPYNGRLRNLSARNAYTEADIKEINRLAQDNKLDVIPLVQTFGHLEFVLKLEEFSYLRETPDFPQEVCPTHTKVMDLIREMLRQVRTLHPHARFMHIGCDEVFHLGVCERCSAQLRQHEATASFMSGDGRFVLFAKHVARVARMVRDELGMTAIIWDDMLRQQGPRLVGSELTGLVEPMVWVYTEDITHLVPHFVWHFYATVFPNIWVAGVYKGASGETALLPNMPKHVANTAAWLRVVGGQDVTGKRVRHFRGIVLTGWSRYDHFAVLCELLPAALPSLILTLTMLKSGKSLLDEDISRQAAKLLGCDEFPDVLNRRSGNDFPVLSGASLAADPHQLNIGGTCAFPGSNVLSLMRQLVSIQHEVKELHTELTERQAWMTAYNVRHGFSSPWRVAEALGNAKHPFLMSTVNAHVNASQRILGQYFDNYVVTEWQEQRLQPLCSKMKELQDDGRKLMSRKHWPRRPLN